MENEYIKYIVGKKYAVQFKDLTICDLREYLPDRKSNGYDYQVHCDNKKYSFSHLYNNLDIAVDKFIGIKNSMENANDTEGKN
jgi:hypothetical protein